MDAEGLGRDAVAVARQYGFHVVDTSVGEGDVHYVEAADLFDGSIIFHVSGHGRLIKAVPRGEWVRRIELAFPNWRDQPYVTTITQLQAVLATPGVL